MSKPKIRDKALRAVRNALRHADIIAGSRLVVAVSGGQDSLTLLYALHNLASEFGFELHGAHLNHNLRGADSDSDSVFVQQMFRNLDIPCTVEQADVSAFQKSEKISMEDAARRLRHEFFARVAEQQNADFVALGHTSDDQAETILLHMIRGSGLAGLRGMDFQSNVEFSGQKMKLLRPLLNISRQDTAEFCRAMNIEPRLDVSNFSNDLSRNRVRLDILPQMEVINPAVKGSLIRLSRSVARDFSYLQSQVDAVLPTVVSLQGGVVEIARNAFGELEPSIQSHVIRRAVLLAKNDLTDVEQIHVEEMARLMNGQPGKSLNLPGGLQFLVSYDAAFIGADGSMPCPLPPLTGETTLQIPGETRVEDWIVTVSLIERKDAVGDIQPTGSRLGYMEQLAVSDDELVIRTRQPGDRFQPLGMSSTKKLQDFMVDEKIPRHWRDRVPLVVAPKGIAWVVGWRIADWARARDDASEIMEIEFRLDLT